MRKCHDSGDIILTRLSEFDKWWAEMTSHQTQKQHKQQQYVVLNSVNKAIFNFSSF